MSTIRPKLHHVTFKTARLEEMVAWYGTVLGSRVMFRNEVAAWTTNDEANHRIAFLAVPGLHDDPEKTSRTGMHHCAFEYKDFAELMSSYKRLSEAGVEPAFCLDHGMTVSIYYRDPDGNFVELQCDVFGDWTASGEFMRGADFAANPIGAFFDAGKVHAAHLAGEGLAALHRKMRAEQFAPAAIPNIGLPG